MKCQQSLGSPQRIAVILLLACQLVFADSSSPMLGMPQPFALDVPGYLARVELNEPMQVESALKRAEQFYLGNQLSTNLPPVVLVMHGPEVEIFRKSNYQKYKSIIDLAARLDAFKVVDVRVCRTRMSLLELEEEDLYPFVGTVAFGPAEITRLLEKEKYLYF